MQARITHYYQATFDTPLGHMIAIANDTTLVLLEFTNNATLERKIKRVHHHAQSPIITGNNALINAIQSELAQYYAGALTTFKTPVLLVGSPFQQRVWQELKKIPHGETRSYADIARALGKPTAYRAVAQANGANHLAIIIPCHRVINTGGAMGGYGGGVARKEWLLNHERHT